MLFAGHLFGVVEHMNKSIEYPLPFDIVSYAGKSLAEQCSLLGLVVIYAVMPLKESLESSALQYYEDLGCEGTFCEGKYIFSIIHALILDGLELHNKANSSNRRLAASRSLKQQLHELDGLHDLVFEYILTTSVLQFKNNLEDILFEMQSYKGYPESYIEFAQRIVGHLDRESLLDLTYNLASDDKLFRGWPDLIIADDDGIQLVEIKSDDKLTINQLYTIYKLKKWFDNIVVMRVDKKVGHYEPQQYKDYIEIWCRARNLR